MRKINSHISIVMHYILPTGGQMKTGQRPILGPDRKVWETVGSEIRSNKQT